MPTGLFHELLARGLRGIGQCLSIRLMPFHTTRAYELLDSTP